MSRFGLCGPAYASQSLIADAQVCRNWILEKIESETGKSAFAMYDREGLVIFGQLPDSPLRGLSTDDVSGIDVGRTFAVAGSSLFEISSAGVGTRLATVNNDGSQVTWAANATATQVALCSGGQIYVITLATSGVTAIPTSTFSQGLVAQISWVDDFFVASIQNTNIFYNSAVDNALSWPGANVNQVSVFPGNIRGIISDQRQLFVMGASYGAIYYNSGASTTPIIPIPGGNIAGGICAPAALMRQDNTVFCLDGDLEKGNGIFRRYASGGLQRVSNHAIEYAWQQYPKISDCIGFPYQNNGHAFCVLYFPSANSGRGATWVYDVATGQWAERDYWANGVSSAYLARCHTFNFGKHLVGDWNSGNIYRLDSTVQTDLGGAMRRVRRAPHISIEQQWIYHHQMQVDLEVGLGPSPPLTDGAGNARDPQAMLRWSDDGGKTYGNDHWADCGQIGQYKKRVIWRRLGRSRDRVYELTATDPVPFRVIDAYLKADPGFTVQKRLPKELLERA
jgi:hypothetical protein